MHQDLDARLVDVVAPAELVVGAQDRLDVAQHVALVQERLDRLGEERRAAEPAADHHLEAGLAGAVAVQPQRQVVDAQRGAVVARRADRDLELARQEGEFRMQRHMLADDLGPDARILDLVGRDAGPLVGGDVAHAIAAGLHAVHADAGEIGHRVRQFLELDPVVLDVLPRGEMAVAAIVAARDMRQHAQLLRRQRAVGDGDAQHVGVELQIDAIHQPQRLELVLGQLARQAARDLVAKIRDALGDERAVEIVIEIHARPVSSFAQPWSLRSSATGSWIVGPLRRMLSRRFPGSTPPAPVSLTGAIYGPTARGRRRSPRLSASRASVALVVTSASSRAVVQPPPRGDKPRRRRRPGWRSRRQVR